MKTILLLLWVLVPLIYLKDDQKELNKYGQVDYSDNFWPQFRLSLVFLFVYIMLLIPLNNWDFIKPFLAWFYMGLMANLIKDIGMALYLNRPYYYLGFTSKFDLLQRKIIDFINYKVKIIKIKLNLKHLFYFKIIILLTIILLLWKL